MFSLSILSAIEAHSACYFSCRYLREQTYVFLYVCNMFASCIRDIFVVVVVAGSSSLLDYFSIVARKQCSRMNDISFREGMLHMHLIYSSAFVDFIDILL